MTAQAHERLILDGEHTSLACVPPLPFGHPRLRRRKPNRNILARSTACERRYIGSWQIADDRLYLLGLDGYFKLAGPEPLIADWFTGFLRVPAGEELHSVLFGFATVYAEELFIEIEKAVVVDRFRQDNRHRTSGLHDVLSKEPPDPDDLGLALGHCLAPRGVLPRRWRELLQRLG